MSWAKAWHDEGITSLCPPGATGRFRGETVDLLAIGGLALVGIAVIQRTSRARRREPEMSNAQFRPITTTEELDAVFGTDGGGAKVVFLDDPHCPISAAARRQVKQLDGEVLTIDVSRRSDLSREVETRTGIRHESPQAMVVNDGVVVWDASHGRISRDAITQAIERAGQKAGADSEETPPRSETGA